MKRYLLVRKNLETGEFQARCEYGEWHNNHGFVMTADHFYYKRGGLPISVSTHKNMRKWIAAAVKDRRSLRRTHKLFLVRLNSKNCPFKAVGVDYKSKYSKSYKLTLR